MPWLCPGMFQALATLLLGTHSSGKVGCLKLTLNCMTFSDQGINVTSLSDGQASLEASNMIFCLNRV